jgi:AcrR family transcriptional regulator
MTTRTADTDVPRRRARRGEGDRLREDILQATIGLLAETGDLDAVSIRAVAKRVGVTPPSIYLHFPDKQSLLDAACEPVFADLARYFAEACLGVASPLERLGRMGVAYVQFALDNREPFRIVFMSRCESDTIMSMTPADLEAQTAFGPVIQTVVEAQQAGMLGAGNAREVAMRLWIGVHGVASLLISKPYFPWPPIEQLVNDFVCMVGLGLLVQTRVPGSAADKFATMLADLPAVESASPAGVVPKSAS